MKRVFSDNERHQIFRELEEEFSIEEDGEELSLRPGAKRARSATASHVDSNQCDRRSPRYRNLILDR